MISAHKLARTLMMAAVVTLFTLIGAFAVEYSVVEVDVDQLNLRAEGNTECEILTKLSRGNLLLVENVEDAEWIPVVSSEYGEGYIASAYVKPFALESGEEVFGLGRVNAGPLNIRSWASTAANKIGQLSTNSKVTLLEYVDGWYKIALDDGEGYVSAEFITLAGEATVANGTLGEQIAQNALQYIGHRYVYGGSTPSGFDCSGFTMYIYAQYGYSLYHGATAQYGTGTRISKGELMPGDLVFFNPKSNGRIGHVGIYIGGGQFVHASTREYLVRTDNLNSGYYCNNYVGAVRIV